jgi:type I restriction enzyme, S subunit
MSELPDGWEAQPLASVVQRPDYGFTASAQLNPIGPKFLRITDIQNGSVDWAAVPHCSIDDAALSQKLLSSGDVVVARIGATTGKAFLIQDAPHAVFASYMIRLRTLPEKLLPAFLYYFMQTDAYWSHIEQNKSGRLKGGVNVPVLLSLSIRYPKEINEQRVIVDVLDQCRVGINTERAAEETANELKRAAMACLFTRGLRGEAQKETEIGPMPESWELRTILELCEIWSGGTPRKSVAEYWKGHIPWVSGKDLKTPALDDAVDHISASGVEAASRLAPTGAVLLLVRGMGLAKDLPVAVINRPMAFNQDVKALVSRGEYSGQFLRSAVYAGKERLLSQIVPSAHGTMTLNLNDVETFKVACPTDPDEADEIVGILEALDCKIALHRQKRALLEELFHSLLHKLMTGEIRVSDLNLSALPANPARATETTA